MERWKKVVLVVCAVLLAGLLFTVSILPLIVRSQLEQQVSKATGRVFTVAGVSINPLNWSAEVRGAKLRERGGEATFASFSTLRVRVSTGSLWRMAPVIGAVNVRAPYLHLVRTSANTYNFTDILEKQPKKKESSEPVRFSLNNIVIENGRIEFDDRAIAQPRQHRVERLAVQVPFISNIPYFADRYVAPDLSAMVNGAPFHFGGKLKPFAEGVEAVVNVNLKELDIPFYAAYFPQELPLRVAGGTLSSNLEISHRLVKGGKPEVNLSGSVGVQGLSLTEKSGAPLLAWKGLAATINRAGIMTGTYDLALLTIDRPELALARDRKGGWSYQHLTGEHPATPEEKKGEKPANNGTKARVSIKALRLQDGIVHFRDDLPPGGFATEARQLNFQADDFATYGDKPATYRLDFLTGRQERAEVKGSLVMEPLAVSSRITLADVIVESYYPYLASTLREAVRGRIDASTELAYGEKGGLTLSQAMLRLRNLKVPFGPLDGVRLPLVIAEGGSFSLKDRSLTVGRVKVDGGSIEFSRDEAGTLSSTLLLTPSTPAEPTAASGGKPPEPLQWRINTVAVNGLDVNFSDGTKEEKPRFSLKKIKATAAKVTGPRFGPIPFTFAAGYGNQGSLAAQGRIVPQPFQVAGDCTLRRIPLLDADPYLPDGVNVVLVDGKLDATLSFDLATQRSGLSGSFRGAAGIRDFYSMDAEENEDLLKWESLQLDGINGTLQPFTLAMSGVTLHNYYARVIVNKSGRINLQDLYTPPAKDAASSAPAPSVAAPLEPAAPAPAGKSVHIDSITLQEGVLNFTDRHLNREFSTTMLNLGGRVSGLTSEAGQVADVDLRGNLENHSPLRIVGKINPLQGDLFLDLLIGFSDIELPPMTPYSGTYLGYAIDKGKLTLELKYHIEQKKLTAENKVFMDQFAFGDRMESAKATSLPVRLAVALLKDSRGEIHLDLPLSGRTDDPKFSIWGIIGEMLKNLLVKVATSPFALLQATFGGGDDFSAIAFAPGASYLAPGEEVKLQALAKAFRDRPALKLEVTGFVDKERDAEGYRSELLLKKMKTEKFRALVKEKGESAGLTPETVEISPAEQSLWLKTVYEKEKFPRPRTIIGTLKTLPDVEMRKLILANTVAGEEQLRTLARERAAAVMSFLTRKGNLPQERIFEKGGDIFAPPRKEGGGASRVEFGVVVK